MKRRSEMSSGEHLVMTVLVLLVVGGFLIAGSGCTQVVHSDDPEWEYPVR